MSTTTATGQMPLEYELLGPASGTLDVMLQGDWTATIVIVAFR